MRFLLLACMLICSSSLYAQCGKEVCCEGMGGISYCDSSGGRYVCNNGYYSSCYCTRHAVMDFQDLQGCCLWNGGVSPVLNLYGLVVCRDGTISELCSIQTVNQSSMLK
jgi:hypothetical protein